MKQYKRFPEGLAIKLSPVNDLNGWRYEIDDGQKIYRIDRLNNYYTRDFRAYKSPEKIRKATLVGKGAVRNSSGYSGTFGESRSKVIFEDGNFDGSPLEGKGVKKVAKKVAKVLKKTAIYDLATFKQMSKTIKREVSKIDDALPQNEYYDKIKDIISKHKSLLKTLTIEFGVPAVSLAVTTALGSPEFAPVVAALIRVTLAALQGGAVTPRWLLENHPIKNEKMRIAVEAHNAALKERRDKKREAEGKEEEEDFNEFAKRENKEDEEKEEKAKKAKKAKEKAEQEKADEKEEKRLLRKMADKKRETPKATTRAASKAEKVQNIEIDQLAKKNTYCGARKVPEGKKIGTEAECVSKRQIRQFGVQKIGGGRSSKMAARNQLVKKIMKEKNMSMVQASSYIKANGLKY